MENYPIGQSQTKESFLDSLRIKVTEKCPWQCSFCHNEGDMTTSDLTWGAELQETITAFKKALPTLREIHYTGGEPTKNRELATLTAGLTAMGFEVKTTSNGQFNEEELVRLKEAGLSTFNFSVLSLQPEIFLQMQGGRGALWQEKILGQKKQAKELKRDVVWAKEQIDRQQVMITKALEMGFDVKMNTILSTGSEANLANVQKIFDWAKEHSIPMRLLNDLGNGLESIMAIRTFIESLGAEEVMRKVTLGSSSCSTVYRLADGYQFAFKQIRDNKLESMCQDCKIGKEGRCEEQFYGIRLQQGKDGKYYVILCIQEKNRKNQMTVEDFFKSQQLKEIKYLIE